MYKIELVSPGVKNYITIPKVGTTVLRFATNTFVSPEENDITLDNIFTGYINTFLVYLR